jgi:hypothetical protein
MALQVSDIKDAFGRLKRDITDVPNDTLVEWCDYVNKTAYRLILGVDPDRYIDSSSTYTVTASPSTQALPATFMNLQPINTGFFLVDSNGDTQTRLPETGPGSSNKGYYLDGSNVVFTGIANEVYRLRYVVQPTKIDDLTDYMTLDTSVSGAPIIEDQYLEYAVKAVDVLYNQWDEEPGSESLADFRFIRVLNEMLSNMKKTPASYNMEDYTLMY